MKDPTNPFQSRSEVMEATAAGETLSEYLTRYARDIITRKYVVRADERQKAMGLSYVTVEVDDLAKEIGIFASLAVANETVDMPDFSFRDDDDPATKLAKEAIAAGIAYLRSKEGN